MKLLAILFCAVTERALAAEAPDFSRDVRPILSQHCFKCHGPDDKARKGGLRLDVRESAMKEAKSGGIAIVPGKPHASELVARIFSADADELMPPPSAKRALSPEQKETLRKWIAAGAEYREHWAFVKPKQAGPPAVKHGGWPRNAIDRFVLARLEAAGLAPSPEADAATLCRRLFLDLTGIPPTPAEAGEFAKEFTATDSHPVTASSAAARDAVVAKWADRLLASPRYGERWARKWLDLARYADTNGYEKDRTRSIWPYRDWVINALNADMPFDQFTIEQIAGDMLPGASAQQRIATGFHRNTMLNEEGGIDPNEFRFYAMTDRVATTGATWLGLTLGCAQCHTHKFDPITQREYYQIMAFLNNADEPEMDLPAPDGARQQKDNAERAAKLLAELPGRFPIEKGDRKDFSAEESAARRAELLDEKFAEWLRRERAHTVAWQPLRPVSAKSNLPLLTIEPDASVFASGDISKADTYEIHFRDIPANVTAVRLEVLPDERLPAHGPGMTFYEGPRGDFFLGELQLASDGKPVTFARASESYAKNNFGKNPASAALAIDGDPQTGWSTADRPGERHVAIFNFAQPAAAASDWTLKLVMGRHYACSLGRFRVSVTTDGGEVVARDLPAEVEALLQLPDATLTAAQRSRLREEFLLSLPEFAKDAAQIRALRKPVAGPTTLAFRERPPENPRATFVHNRGEFLQPTDRIEPGVPAFLNALPQGGGRDRLAFARWLVSPENPLTARVIVNRQWAAFFGRGIVKTTEDFGYQGDAPTHPELLDWLAVEFMKQGWSLKKLHRLIVMSATYRQRSEVRSQKSDHAPADAPAPDPENRLLSRFPRVRLDAEIVRDAALAASSLLVEKVGGPSVYPPQPDGVTEAAYGNPKWNASTGPDRHRRSLYTFSKRTAPFALYNTFDAPTGEACIARRDVSDTALQALTLLNDVVFIEAAQALGKELSERTGETAGRAREAFLRVLAREPEPAELAALVRFFEAQQARFSEAKSDAAKFAGEGGGAAAARAAWTALARALFNLDEFVTKN